jgi:hypothetical protein
VAFTGRIQLDILGLEEKFSEASSVPRRSLMSGIAFLKSELGFFGCDGFRQQTFANFIVYFEFSTIRLLWQTVYIF